MEETTSFRSIGFRAGPGQIYTRAVAVIPHPMPPLLGIKIKQVLCRS